MEQLSYERYLDKIYGCFLGKTVIGTLGAPYEGIKMPLELPFKPEMINTMLPNDDLDLQVLWLDVAEKYGPDFTSDQLLERFVTHCDYSPGEYAIMRKNWLRGIRPPASGSFCNDFYTEGMGCPIRSEIWACLAPLDPARAADFASRDGCLDHWGESVYAERFLAALESAAFGVDEHTCDLHALIRTGLEAVPQDCRFRELVEDTLALCGKYDDVKLILRKLLFKYGHPDCTNMLQNMGITLTALLKGNLDEIKTGMDALNCGFDTDCTCATAGAIIGLVRGAASLEKQYGWGDIHFVLGVTSQRRSDSVFDFSEDVAALGKVFNPGRIQGGPDRAYTFVTDPSPVRLSVIYQNGEDERPDASIALGDTRSVALILENRTDAPLTVDFTVSGLGCQDAGQLTLPAGGDDAHIVMISVPEDLPELSEINTYTVQYTAGDFAGTYTFGLAGATPWKAVGPIWRTDPICTTEKLMAVPNYWHLMQEPGYKGDQTDIVRRFHLNCAVDTATPYMSPEELDTPLDPEVDTRYEETLFSQRQDSFTMEDICGFRGPSVVYLVRELVSPCEEEVCVQLGHSAPVALWINGQLVAERTGCDCWDAENIHVQHIPIHQGVNRVILRLTRVNGDAKFNLTFATGACCASHILHYRSVNPRFFGGR